MCCLFVWVLNMYSVVWKCIVCLLLVCSCLCVCLVVLGLLSIWLLSLVTWFELIISVCGWVCVIVLVLVMVSCRVCVVGVLLGSVVLLMFGVVWVNFFSR